MYEKYGFFIFYWAMPVFVGNIWKYCCKYFFLCLFFAEILKCTLILTTRLRWPWLYCCGASWPVETYLDSDHHVEVTLAVLLNHVPHVVRLPGLLELPPGHEVFDLPDGPDGVAVSLGQPVEESPALCQNQVMQHNICNTADVTLEQEYQYYKASVSLLRLITTWLCQCSNRGVVAALGLILPPPLTCIISTARQVLHHEAWKLLPVIAILRLQSTIVFFGFDYELLDWLSVGLLRQKLMHLEHSHMQILMPPPKLRHIYKQMNKFRVVCGSSP